MPDRLVGPTRDGPAMQSGSGAPVTTTRPAPHRLAARAVRTDKGAESVVVRCSPRNAFAMPAERSNLSYLTIGVRLGYTAPVISFYDCLLCAHR